MKKSFWNNKKQSFFGMKFQRNHGYDGYVFNMYKCGEKTSTVGKTGFKMNPFEIMDTS